MIGKVVLSKKMLTFLKQILFLCDIYSSKIIPNNLFPASLSCNFTEENLFMIGHLFGSRRMLDGLHVSSLQTQTF